MQAFSALPPAPFQGLGLLSRLDPRLKLLLAAGFGLLLWNAGAPALACVAAVLAPALWQLAVAGLLGRQALLAAAGFAGFWSLAAFGLALWEGAAAATALGGSLFLGLRLLLLMLLGLTLALSSGARQLGLGICWLLRPFAGRKAWQAALAFSLLVRFLPQTVETLAQVRRMERLRAPERPLWQRFGLMAQTVLRVMAQNAWKQTMALAGRGLDTPDAWEPHFEFCPRQWFAGLGVLALCAGVALW